MRRYGWILLGLLLAMVIHADWHLARPHHHGRLSFECREHWLIAAALFAAVGCIVARVWPRERWTIGAWTLALGIFVAQVLEPILEVVSYAHRLGYASEPERWVVFGICMAAGIPAYALALWLCAPSREADLRPAT
jgi:hypothetical protein